MPSGKNAKAKESRLGTRKSSEELITYSACLEWLFAPEAPAFADRFRLAKEFGFEAVEFWGWRNKDIDSVEAALTETGLTLTSFVTEPMVPLTDPEQHEAFLAGLFESVGVAHRLGASGLIAQAGGDRQGVARKVQHEAIAEVLRRAAGLLAGTGVTLLLEPLNTKVDHPGYYLDRTSEGLDIVGEAGDPSVRLLYDIYHSVVMGELPEQALAGRLNLVGHIHLADAPGRAEPGTGQMDWRAHLRWLRKNGYDGYVGLEYRPSGSTKESLAWWRQAESTRR